MHSNPLGIMTNWHILEGFLIPGILKGLDEFGLMMIEQPLASDDIIDHRILQKELITPICLDESIHSYEDAREKQLN